MSAITELFGEADVRGLEHVGINLVVLAVAFEPEARSREAQTS
jgi:hypothetical protein